jgi:5'(3')-deoxyribonucleotidase
MKEIVLVDMDNVLVNFQSGIDQLSEETKVKYEDRLDEVPGIFKLMEPMVDAIESYHWLSENYDTYILSTAPWGNPSAWSDKLNWVKKHLHDPAYKRLILSHHKNLVMGDYLIDDRTARGVDKFQGTHIHFGTDEFKDWESVRIWFENLKID